MGWVRVARVQGKKAYNAGKGPGGGREMTPFEEKYGPWVLGIFIGAFVLLFLIALIFG